MHFVVYGTLAALWSWALDREHRRIWHAVVGVVVYGVVLEVIQLAVPGRFSSVLDIALNTAGAVAAASMVTLWGRQRSGGASE